MTLYIKKTDDGDLFLRGDLGPRCIQLMCGWVGDYLCDYPVGKDKTCSRPMCDSHANEIAPEVHYCQLHHDEWLRFKESGGVNKVLENVTPYKRGR